MNMAHALEELLAAGIHCYKHDSSRKKRKSIVLQLVYGLDAADTAANSVAAGANSFDGPVVLHWKSKKGETFTLSDGFTVTRGSAQSAGLFEGADRLQKCILLQNSTRSLKLEFTTAHNVYEGFCALSKKYPVSSPSVGSVSTKPAIPAKPSNLVNIHKKESGSYGLIKVEHHVGLPKSKIETAKNYPAVCILKEAVLESTSGDNINLNTRTKQPNDGNSTPNQQESSGRENRDLILQLDKLRGKNLCLEEITRQQTSNLEAVKSQLLEKDIQLQNATLCVAKRDAHLNEVQSHLLQKEKDLQDAITKLKQREGQLAELHAVNAQKEAHKKMRDQAVKLEELRCKELDEQNNKQSAHQKLSADLQKSERRLKEVETELRSRNEELIQTQTNLKGAQAHFRKELQRQETAVEAQHDACRKLNDQVKESQRHLEEAKIQILEAQKRERELDEKNKVASTSILELRQSKRESDAKSQFRIQHLEEELKHATAFVQACNVQLGSINLDHL